MRLQILHAEVRASTHDIQLVLECDPNNYRNVHDALKEIADTTEIEISKAKQKRSLDANALAWVLIRSLAKEQGLSEMEVYRHEIQDMYTYNIYPIKDTDLDNYMHRWSSRGSGWICEPLGACQNFKGYTNVKCYYGTSVYTKKEMSDFIDKIIMDCKAIGLDTRSPDEIEKAKALWGE